VTTDPNEDAVTLVEIVEDEFRFLGEHGFHSVVEDESSVRFERGDGVFVRVFRDQRDKYVGFRIGLSSRPRDALTATELAKLSGVAVPRGEYPERADQLRASVARVARDLRIHGDRPLGGDETIYDEAMELRRAYTQQYTRPNDRSSDPER
jgi:hypothetical protein